MSKLVSRGYVLGCVAFFFVLGCEAIDSAEYSDIENAELDERAATTGHTSDNLVPNGLLTSNQYLQSTDGSHRVYLQSDGNLVLRRMSDQKALWSSATNGKSATRFLFQGDGNLVLRTASGTPVWSSKTAGTGATRLHLNSAGQLVLYKNSTVVWSVNGTPTTKDECPNDPNKTVPGQCGCGVPEGTCSTGQKVRFFVVGDTQKINNEDPSRYSELLRRLPQESQKMGVNFVFQTGDNTEDGKQSNWERAQTGWRQLDGKTPYVLNVGNNDRMNGNLFSTYFPLSRYKAWTSFVSAYENYDNAAHQFTAGGVRWLVLSLRYSDSSNWASWAENLIKAHPSHNVVILNHDENGTMAASKLANNYDNVKFIFAGHTNTSNSGSVKVNKFGHKWVYYKHCWHSKSMDEYFAMIEIDLATGSIKGKYYSPYQGKYWSDSSASLYSQRPSWDNWTWSGVAFTK